MESPGEALTDKKLLGKLYKKQSKEKNWEREKKTARAPKDGGTLI